MEHGAHHRASDRRCLRAAVGVEGGFSLVEIIVVMILIGIAMLAALTTITSVKKNGNDARYAVSAGLIWRGIGAYRLDAQGALPSPTLLANGGRSFKNLGGARYVRTWPDDPSTGGPLQVVAGRGATAPRTGPADTLVLAVNGNAGWLAAYGADRQVVFLRSVTNGAVEAPVG